MKIPRSYARRFAVSLASVDERARAKLEKALEFFDPLSDGAFDAAVAIMRLHCGASASVASRLAAEFYDGLRASFGIKDGFAAEVAQTWVPAATEGATRAFVAEYVQDGDAEKFVEKCIGRLSAETRKSANKCIERNAKRDPKRPKWARVPTGADTCEFCIMLASRGFVYGDEELASHAHANCDCVCVPSWDKKNPALEGYDPDAYYEQYKQSKFY